MKKPLNVLAVGAHPDDIELTCAGTLARCVRRGDTVTVAVLCRGDMASSHLSPDELVKVRSRELENSMKLLNAGLVELGLPDGGVEVNREQKYLVARMLRRVKPDLIITHFDKDYGGDHNHTLSLVLDATVYATVPSVDADTPPLPRIPLLYMMEPLAGHGFDPQVYVDITETFEIKNKMLQCHQSQMEWMRNHGGMDLCNYIDVICRFRGFQARVKYAEGFIPHPSFFHVQAGPVLP